MPRISENRVKALIGLLRRVRSESRGLKRGIQQGHGFPVLLRGFVQIPDGLSGLKRNIQQLGHCAAHKVGNDPVRQGKAIVHPVCGIAHVVQTVRRVLRGVIHIVQPLLKIPEFLLREGSPGPRQIQLQVEIIQLALAQRAVEMFGCLLHLCQSVGCEGGLLRQKPLLLCKQLCIGGVQLQEPPYIPQVFLHIKQLRIGLAKCLAEFCGVTVDLNGDAFDSACQNGTPP